MSLRARLMLALAVVATMIVLSGVAMVMLVRVTLINEVDHQLRSAAIIAASPSLAQLRKTGPLLSPPSMPLPSPGSDLTELYIGEITSDGQLQTFYSPGWLAGHSTPPPALDRSTVAVHAADWGTPAVGFDGESADGSTAYRLVAVSSLDSVFVVGLPTARVDAAFNRVRVGMIVVESLILASLAVTTWWVERLGLRPIRSVTDAAGAIAAGDLDRRVDPPRPRTEAGNLARAFNVMVDERQAWERQLRRFVADASHELRTPLTTILGVMELHGNASLPAGPQLDDALRRARLEARRMADLVEDLLLLAHLDQGRPLTNAPVDIGELALDATLDARLGTPERRITTHVSPTPPVRGDESRLRQVITNLVDNALTHAGDDASIEVAVRPAASSELGDVGGGPGCVLEVTDDGHGMDPEQAAHVFERFFRVDTGRVRRRGGSGLGLSIVRSIVTAHGGQVTLRTGPGAGASFRVVLPCAGRLFQPTSSLLSPQVEAGDARSGHGPADLGGPDVTRPVTSRLPG